MGKVFESNTGETFPLAHNLVSDKKCFINATIDDNGVLTIRKVLWLHQDV